MSELVRVLQASTEFYPLLKTGGLADVAAALPPALRAAGADVRLLFPGLPAYRQGLGPLQAVAEIDTPWRERAKVLRGEVQGLVAYVIDSPTLYARPGNPYADAGGAAYADNHRRFGLLGLMAARLGGGLDASWQPHIVHGHDWHAGLASAYLRLMRWPGKTVARSVFTVHNLAYQGLFPHEDRALLGLSSDFMSPDGLEYHGQLSFMKAGLKFADRITTVSPSYAREIATHEFGCGLDGVIRGRGSDVSGILNGIDPEVWNPATDPAIAQRYSAEQPAGKAVCKAALQAEFGLKADPDAPLLLALSRLSSQKGLDLILSALPQCLEQGTQLVVQGAGDPALEAAFRMAAAAHPGRVAVHIGYDEARAHRLMAGADLIVVPSRFEPCGLTQLYGLRYGTLPVVRRVGGLADTVVDAPGEAATGFHFDHASAAELGATVVRAVQAWRDPTRRRQIMNRAMAQDFSWVGPARQYLNLYEDTVHAD